MIRVLQVLPQYTSDGPSKGTTWLARYLDPQRFDTLICSLSAARTTTPDVPVVSLGCDSIFDVRTLFRLTRLIRKWRPDVVHTHMVRPDWYGRVAAWICRVPVICTSVRNEDDYCYVSEFGRTGARVIEIVNRITGRLADQFVAVSDGVRAYLLGRQRVSSSRVVVIPNGVDLSLYDPEAHSPSIHERYGIPANAIVVGTLAALKEQKGLGYLIEAAAAVRDSASADIRFVVGGRGPEETRLRARISELGLDGRVVLAGQVSDVSDFLAAIDVFALPSLWEGMPRALLEAMAAGRPCVVTDIGGSREVVTNGIDGIVIPPADASALARAIVRLAEGATERATFGEAARRTVEDRFSAQRVAQLHATLYDSLLGRKTG